MPGLHCSETLVVRRSLLNEVGGFNEVMTRVLLQTVGMTPQDVQYVTVSTANRVPALVQGQVDATTKLVGRREASGGAARLRFAVPKGLARYIVMRGFVTLDGVSLTIAGLGKTFFEVALMPHTAESTTLGALAPGDLVNVESDVLARYVERLVKKA